MSPRNPRTARARGFSLVELIAVIVILGVVSTVASIGIRESIQSYELAKQRAELSDMADNALRRISRDIRNALPYSLRDAASGSTQYLELLLTKDAGRYRSADDPPEEKLDFAATDTSFDTIGSLSDQPQQEPLVNDIIVVFNSASNPATLTNNAYTFGSSDCLSTATDNCNTTTITSLGTSPAGYTRIGIAERKFPRESTSKNFYVMNANPAISYECIPGAVDSRGNGTGTLKRYVGYPVQLSQPTPPSSGSAALVTRYVSSCSIVIKEAVRIVYLSLTLTRDGQSVALYHEIEIGKDS